MVELYTMQRYLQYDTLREKDLIHFDAWASTFGETVTQNELAPEGKGYRPRTRFSRFFNLPELMAMFKEVADIKTADELNLPTPEVIYETVVAKPTEIQQELVQELSERAARIHNDRILKDDFKITIKGDTLTDKDNAGAAILEACKEVKNSDPVEIGSYKGFTMYLSYAAFGNEHTLTLKGAMSHTAKLGLDARGNLTRIDNALNGMQGRLQSVQKELENLYNQQAAAKVEVQKP